MKRWRVTQYDWNGEKVYSKTYRWRILANIMGWLVSGTAIDGDQRHQYRTVITEVKS